MEYHLVHTKRAEIIFNALNPNLEPIRDKITLLIYNTIAVNILEKILIEFPTVRETIKCSN